MRWYEELLGRPWEANPRPPHSFTCGELVRYVFLHRLGIESPPIIADAGRVRESIANLDIPEHYCLFPFEDVPRPFDVVYAMRKVRRDHIGIAVQTVEGLLILHCSQGGCVTLDSLSEIQGLTGCRYFEWRRHQSVTKELAQCRA